MNSDEFIISPLGDSALIIDFGNIIDEIINKKILTFFHTIKQLSLPCIKDVVPAYSSLVVHYDILIVKQAAVTDKTAYEILNEEIKKIIDNIINSPAASSRIIKIPICYAENFALDINDIAKEKKLPVDEIILLHTSKKYRVYMIGFLPGFAYMGEIDKQIEMPRKPQPRIKVEAGSVGIAGLQTGIYPLDSPGGWQIIGKTPLQLFNKQKNDPVLLQPGDEIEFYSITENEFTNY